MLELKTVGNDADARRMNSSRANRLRSIYSVGSSFGSKSAVFGRISLGI
jgi:hypothetical protein